ncbi:MAG: MFS transporter [Candidatus Uhrbacteria bacterium]
MTREEKLQRNPKILFWGRALTELKTINGLATLFYLHRGISLEQVFYLGIVWSVTTLLFEIPSGYLADRFGRKKTLILGTLFLMASVATNFLANGFWAFAGVMTLLSAASSCFSGTEEAVLYDSLIETGREKEMTAFNGRLHSARHVFKIFLPTIGVLIASQLTEGQFKILISLDLLAAVAAFIVLAFLTEPRHLSSVAQREIGILKESFTTLKNHPFLFRAALNKIIIFVMGFLIFRAYQPFLVEKGLPVIYLGLYYFIIHAIIFILHWKIGVIEKKIGAAKILTWSVVISMPLLFLLTSIENPFILFVMILLVTLLETGREPVFAEAMNTRIKSGSRATTLSNLNFIKGVVDIPLLFLTGWLTHYQTENVFYVCLALCLIVLIFFHVREKDLATVPILREEYLPE